MTTLPPLSDVHAKLRALNHHGVRALADESGVPECTLLGIRYTGTKNPRYDTVVSIWPHIDALIETPAFQSRQYRAEAVAA